MLKKTITLSGKKIDLEYPNSSVRALDNALGVSALTLLTKAYAGQYTSLASLDTVAKIIWAGTLSGKRPSSVEEITDLVPLQMKDYLALVSETTRTVSQIYGIDDMEVNAEVDEDEDPGNVTGQRPSGAGGKRKK